jgi:hypothetical protein
MLVGEALPDPGAFPLGSVESRAAARRLLEALAPLETCVYTDEDGWPIFEPGVRYATALIEVPLSVKTGLTIEQWLARTSVPDDPVERERWEERRKIQAAVWCERQGLLARGLCTLSPDQERIQREKQRAYREARERSKRSR